jgi:NADH:ubiquinone oxidoreductase subunit 6 (subunit J)/NADH:ubiquinone oxidoreductase subunit 3 (subunit A)
MEFFLSSTGINAVLPILAVISAIFVITTQNPIYSVLNLIVLYILVAFYLIFKGITYIGLSYVIIYVGAIAILFLFILMMIDIEIVEKRHNNYLPLLCLLLVGSVFILKNIMVKYGLTKGDNLGYESLEKFQGIFDLDLELFELENLDVHYDINGKPNVDIDIQDYFADFRPYPDLSIDDPIYPFISKIYLELWVQVMREVLDIMNDENRIIWFEEVLYKNIPWLDDLFSGKVQIIDNISYDIIENSYNTIGNLEYEWYPDRDTFFESDMPYDGDGSFVLEDIYDGGYLVKENIFDILDEEIEISDSWISNGVSIFKDLFNYDNEYYMLFIPDWENAVNRVTQISAIGDILYSVYHSYIYILSAILLLGMVGAIMLTAEKNEEVRVIPIIKKTKKMSIAGIPAFYSVGNLEVLESEGLIDSLSYFIVIVLIINILLFGVNTFLSVSMKYFDKEGGFECGFTSFVQTRERFNIIFYRVALLFLIFDLEIILIFPYTAINHNSQSISKNNVLAFLYILVVGFIFELKEGALEIVKKAHPIQLNIKI